MRGVVLAALLVPAVVAAEPRPLVVWNNTVSQPDPGTSALSISNTVYLNDCRPNGCALSPGFDDSRTHHSSIASSSVVLDAWGHGDQAWTDLVACVKETFLPFNINVVTEDPGTASHFEVMVGGYSTQLNPQLTMAGGVAPVIGCGASTNNAISFVFASQSQDLNYLCGAVAQEAAHVWGLDHELNALDPMTYLQLGSKKRFQNNDAQCGERLDQPRGCYCGGDTQNSYTYLTQLFGAADLPAATLALGTPADGQWVRTGFPVRATLTSVLGETTAELSIDGHSISTLTPGPFAFNAPTSLAGGDHTVKVTATDGGGRAADATATVHVMVACTASVSCGSGMHCLGGYCLPGSSIDGGLGAACTDNAGCITGSCGQADGDERCTAVCDAGDVCPDGYTCLNTASGDTTGGSGGVCWPTSADGGGGCAATGGGSPGFLLVGLGMLALVRRRRRVVR